MQVHLHGVFATVGENGILWKVAVRPMIGAYVLPTHPVLRLAFGLRMLRHAHAVVCRGQGVWRGDGRLFWGGPGIVVRTKSLEWDSGGGGEVAWALNRYVDDMVDRVAAQLAGVEITYADLKAMATETA